MRCWYGIGKITTMLKIAIKLLDGLLDICSSGVGEHRRHQLAQVCLQLSGTEKKRQKCVFPISFKVTSCKPHCVCSWMERKRPLHHSSWIELNLNFNLSLNCEFKTFAPFPLKIAATSTTCRSPAAPKLPKYQFISICQYLHIEYCEANNLCFKTLSIFSDPLRPYSRSFNAPCPSGFVRTFQGATEIESNRVLAALCTSSISGSL